jgi:hypothetical protein
MLSPTNKISSGMFLQVVGKLESACTQPLGMLREQALGHEMAQRRDIVLENVLRRKAGAASCS